MNIKNDNKTPYTKSLLSLIEIINTNLKHLNKEIKITKIKAIIIMCLTLIMSFTLFQSVLPLALIISCFINLCESFRLKNKLNIISEHKKTDISIDKFLKSEIELEQKKKFVGTTIEQLQLSSKPLVDLYDCFDTNNIEFLESTAKKYEQKYKEDLIKLEQLKEKDDKQEKK